MDAREKFTSDIEDLAQARVFLEIYDRLLEQEDEEAQTRFPEPRKVYDYPIYLDEISEATKKGPGPALEENDVLRALTGLMDAGLLAWELKKGFRVSNVRFRASPGTGT